MIRVAIVDDHPIFREGVIHTLGAYGDMQVVASGGCAEDAVRIAQEDRPDVLIMDIVMPGNVCEALDVITASSARVSVLVLTVVSDEGRACEAIRKGARGYLLKGVGGAELARAVQAVHLGEHYITPSLAGHLLSHLERGEAERILTGGHAAKLNTREHEILFLIGKGQSNKEIGNALNLSDKTVKHYVTSILTKLGVRNRVEAALVATNLAGHQKTPAILTHGTGQGHARP